MYLPSTPRKPNGWTRIWPLWLLFISMAAAILIPHTRVLAAGDDSSTLCPGSGGGGGDCYTEDGDCDPSKSYPYTTAWTWKSHGSATGGSTSDEVCKGTMLSTEDYVGSLDISASPGKKTRDEYKCVGTTEYKRQPPQEMDASYGINAHRWSSNGDSTIEATTEMTALSIDVQIICDDEDVAGPTKWINNVATVNLTVVEVTSIEPVGKTYAYMHQPKEFQVTTEPPGKYDDISIDAGEGMISSALNDDGIVEISWDKPPTQTAFSDTVTATLCSEDVTCDIAVYDWYMSAETTPNATKMGTVNQSTETYCPWYEYPTCIRWGETTSKATIAGAGAASGITLGGFVHTWSNGASSPQTNNAIAPQGKTEHTIQYQWNGPESTLPSNNAYTVSFSGGGSGKIVANGRFESQDGGCLAFAHGQLSMDGTTSGPDQSINGVFSYTDADAQFYNHSTTTVNAGINFSYENSDEEGAKYAIGGNVSTTTTPDDSDYPGFTIQTGFTVPGNNYSREFSTGPVADWAAEMDLKANCTARSVGNTGVIQPVWQSNEANVDIDSLYAKFDITMTNAPRAAVSPDE